MRSSRECKTCHQHQAIFFRFDGKVRRDPKHDLCQRCYRSTLSALLARNLQNPWLTPFRAPMIGAS